MPPVVPFHNATNAPIHIGTKTIMPGATRDVDDALIPNYAPALAEVVADGDTRAELRQLLENSVRNVVAVLVSLSADDLNLLEQLEAAGANRVGIANGIAQERLVRAQARQVLVDRLAGAQAAFIESIQADDDETLDELLMVERSEQNRSDVIQAIELHQLAREENAIAELLALGPDDIALELVNLSDEWLARMVSAESADEKRAPVLAALTHELTKRALSSGAPLSSQ